MMRCFNDIILRACHKIPYVKQEAQLSQCMGRACQVLITPLREINSPPTRPFNMLSNGVSYLQVDAARSENNTALET